MSIQVIVFSVLLFGTAGVVLDFGRVYSEHSSMQSYTDQAALAAASELDQTAGAIQRAVDAVYGNDEITPISKTAVFSNGDTADFEISHLLFLRDLGDDTGAQYDVGDDLTGGNVVYAAFADGGSAGEDIEAASLEARFVVAVAEERSVRNTLMQLINSTGSDTVRPTQALRTIAAARGSRVTCGNFRDYSSFVMCDPYSIDPDLSFADEMTEVVDGVVGTRNAGRQFRLTADGGLGGLNKIHRLAQHSVAAGARAICDNNATLPGFRAGMSAAELNFTRSICYLSASEPVTGDVCIENGEVAIMPLSGAEVTTALNVAFNMWDEPIADVLDWRGDATRESDMALFQPDLHILKALVWNEGRAITNAAFGLPTASRNNYTHAEDHGDIDLILKPSCLHPTLGGGSNAACAAYSDGGAIGHVGEAPTFGEMFEYLITSNPIRFFSDLNSALSSGQIATYEDAYRILREVGVNALVQTPIPGGEPVPQGGSLVEFPAVDESGVALRVHPEDERRTREDASLLAQSAGVDHLSLSLAFDAAGVPQDLVTNFTPATVDQNGNLTHGDRIDEAPGPDGYQDVISTPLDAGYNAPVGSPINPATAPFTRVFDVTVVNCSAIRSEVNAETGATDFIAPVVGFAEMYLLQPPDPTCGPGGQPWEVGGTQDICLNSNIAEADVYLEYNQITTTIDDTYSVLVR